MIFENRRKKLATSLSSAEKIVSIERGFYETFHVSVHDLSMLRKPVTDVVDYTTNESEVLHALVILR